LIDWKRALGKKRRNAQGMVKELTEIAVSDRNCCQDDTTATAFRFPNMK